MVADVFSKKTSARLHASYNCHNLLLDDLRSTGVQLEVEVKEEVLLVNFQVRPKVSGSCTWN